MIKEEYIDQLKARISEVQLLSDKCWRDFRLSINFQKLSAGQYFSKELSVTKDLGFILEGLVRIYSQDEEGIEWNKSLLRENEFIMASINPTLPSPVSIQAIFQTKLLTIPYRDYMKLSVVYPKLTKVMHSLATSFLDREKTRNNLLMIKKSSDRLDHFKKEFAEIYDRIPKEHVASYIGIDDSELSFS